MREDTCHANTINAEKSHKKQEKENTKKVVPCFIRHANQHPFRVHNYIMSFLFQSREDFKRYPGLDSLTFIFSKNSNYGQERRKGKTLLGVVNAQQCFALMTQANFLAHNLNFY